MLRCAHIFGLDGNEEILGANGNDLIDPGDGDDVVKLGEGHEGRRPRHTVGTSRTRARRFRTRLDGP